jgi:hypothetical protein
LCRGDTAHEPADRHQDPDPDQRGCPEGDNRQDDGQGDGHHGDDADPVLLKPADLLPEVPCRVGVPEGVVLDVAVAVPGLRLVDLGRDGIGGQQATQAWDLVAGLDLQQGLKAKPIQTKLFASLRVTC